MSAVLPEAPPAGTPAAPEQPVVEPYNPFAAEDAEAAARAQALIEEEAARKAAAAVPGGTSEQPPAEVQAGNLGAPAAPAPASVAATAAKTSTNTVESALIALRKQNRELGQALLVEKGKAEAFRSMAQPGAQAGAGEGGSGAPAGKDAGQTTIEDELNALDAQELEIAEKLDRGALSEKEAVEQRIALRKQERELNAERARIENQAVASPQHDLAMEQSLTVLVNEYPILNKLNATQLAPFQALAFQQAEIEGKPIPKTTVGTVELRQRMARLAEQFYDPAAAQARAARVVASGSATAQPQGARPAAGQPATSTPTAAQRAAKLDLAASMPPDIGNFGAGATGGEITVEAGEAILASMNDVDARIRWMDQHPAFVSKVMGRSLGLSP